LFIGGLLVSGCAIDLNPRLTDLLEPDYLNKKLGTETIDLSIDGNCPGTQPLKFVNVEKNNERHVVYDDFGANSVITSQEFTNQTIKYTEKKVIESNLTIDNQSGKIINVSFGKIKVEGFATFEANASMEFNIPEINYTKHFSAVEGSGLVDYAASYAVHLVVVEFLKDPVFQKYVQCR
jgi:hypothetical protein